MEATKIEVIYSFKISEQKITRLEFTYQPSLDDTEYELCKK